MSFLQGEIAVEEGNVFNIGDYAGVSGYGVNSIYRASMVKASYISSKPEIASIDTKGNLTTKKEGKTTVIVKYKGEQASVTVNVERAGSFKATQLAHGVRKELDKLTENMPSKVTIKNGFLLLNKIVDYKNIIDKNKEYANKITEDDLSGKNSGADKMKSKRKVLLPQQMTHSFYD